MEQRKYLLMTIPIDITGTNRAQEEIMKAFQLAGMSPALQAHVHFDVVSRLDVSKREASHMMEHVREEFRRQDQRPRRRRRVR